MRLGECESQNLWVEQVRLEGTLRVLCLDLDHFAISTILASSLRSLRTQAIKVT